jgi:Tol biopolymer transport system component
MPIAQFVVKVMIVCIVVCVFGAAGTQWLGGAIEDQEITFTNACIESVDYTIFFTYQQVLDRNLRIPLNFSGRVNPDEVQWSPDGNQIAFISDTQLFLSDAMGRNPRPLEVYGNDVAWSPDSRSLAFVHIVRGIHQLNILNLQNNHLQTLFQDQYDIGSPTWHPNGREIAFLQSTHVGGVTVIDVSNGTTSAFEVNETISLNGIEWSPDGQKIALSGEGALFVANDLNSEFQAFDVSFTIVTDFSWSINGSQIAFGDSFSGFYILDIASGRVQHLFGFSNMCGMANFTSISWRP